MAVDYCEKCTDIIKEQQGEIKRLQRELRIKVQIVDEQHDAMSDKDDEIKRLREELAEWEERCGDCMDRSPGREE